MHDLVPFEVCHWSGLWCHFPYVWRCNNQVWFNNPIDTNQLSGSNERLTLIITPVPDDALLERLLTWVSHVGDSSIALPRQYICYFQLFSKRSHLWIDQVLLQGSLIICLDPINIYSVFKTFKVSLFTMPCCSSIRDAASCGSRFSNISVHSYGSLHAY